MHEATTFEGGAGDDRDLPCLGVAPWRSELCAFENLFQCRPVDLCGQECTATMTLGEKLVLPPFLEPNRARIAAGLKPID